MFIYHFNLAQFLEIILIFISSVICYFFSKETCFIVMGMLIIICIITRCIVQRPLIELFGGQSYLDDEEYAEELLANFGEARNAKTKKIN